MPSGDVETANAFEEFAENCDELRKLIPRVLQEATERTMRQLRTEVVKIIQDSETSKGGTLDSRTSPYSPGGENDSSTDNLHISDRSAWNIIGPNRTGEGVEARLEPKEAVSDRAWYINYGTDSHEPKNDEPYYFQYRNITIVVSNSPIETEDGSMKPIHERFEGEPQSVDGVEEMGYWQQAIAKIKVEGIIDRELRKAFERALQDSFGSEF
jgi:hypothetical protein